MRPSPFRHVLQVFAFVRKEVADVVHQPRLLLTLVLGPFLVLAAFGAGYRDETEPMRTMFVAAEGSPAREQIDRYTDRLSAFVVPAGVTSSAAVARRALADGEVDLVVVFPDDPLGTVLEGERATVSVVHTRLDPIERTAIFFATELAIGEINSEVLASLVEDGQSVAEAAADRALTDLDDAVAAAGDSATAAQQEDLARLAERVDAVEAAFEGFTTTDADVLVRPLEAKVELAVSGIDDVADWYAPAAVVLMLQQFGIAFGSLSFVRERELGIVDVFRAAPVGPASMVIGKFVAHVLMGMVVGAVLMAAVVALLDVPLSGEPLDAGIVMALTLAASVGLGFVISLASRSDAQAVQYTMIALLASLFFSGFFLSSQQLHGAAAAIGWLLPVTYGMRLLRDVMLRGAGLDATTLAWFGVDAAVVFVLAVFGASRRTGVIRSS